MVKIDCRIFCAENIQYKRHTFFEILKTEISIKNIQLYFILRHNISIKFNSGGYGVNKNIGA
jgi:hypothetical protein